MTFFDINKAAIRASSNFFRIMWIDTNMHCSDSVNSRRSFAPLNQVLRGTIKDFASGGKCISALVQMAIIRGKKLFIMPVTFLGVTGNPSERKEILLVVGAV